MNSAKPLKPEDLKDIKPFEPVTVRLRVPLTAGDVAYEQLSLRPPVLRDILRTDGRDPESIGYALALLSSLSGLPEKLLEQLVPEDWADLRVLLAITNMRFTGGVNLLDKKEDAGQRPETGDPTAAEGGEDTARTTSEPTSAA